MSRRTLPTTLWSCVFQYAQSLQQDWDVLRNVSKDWRKIASSPASWAVLGSRFGDAGVFDSSGAYANDVKDLMSLERTHKTLSWVLENATMFTQLRELWLLEASVRASWNDVYEFLTTLRNFSRLEKLSIFVNNGNCLCVVGWLQNLTFLDLHRSIPEGKQYYYDVSGDLNLLTSRLLALTTLKINGYRICSKEAGEALGQFPALTALSIGRSCQLSDDACDGLAAALVEVNRIRSLEVSVVNSLSNRGLQSLGNVSQWLQHFGLEFDDFDGSAPSAYHTLQLVPPAFPKAQTARLCLNLFSDFGVFPSRFPSVRVLSLGINVTGSLPRCFYILSSAMPLLEDLQFVLSDPCYKTDVLSCLKQLRYLRHLRRLRAQVVVWATQLSENLMRSGDLDYVLNDDDDGNQDVPPALPCWAILGISEKSAFQEAAWQACVIVASLLPHDVPSVLEGHIHSRAIWLDRPCVPLIKGMVTWSSRGVPFAGLELLASWYHRQHSGGSSTAAPTVTTTAAIELDLSGHPELDGTELGHLRFMPLRSIDLRNCHRFTSTEGLSTLLTHQKDLRFQLNQSAASTPRQFSQR